jgi:SAM-dependent methyltransferase
MNFDEPEWFESWFDSPYYHILYKNRDDREAENFIDNLLNRLHLKVPSTVLDLACGKGRHSKYLHAKGHDVTGIDLSAKNIAHNKQFETSNLHFFEHDMRKTFRINYYDAIFNLFTSFGYFAQDHQNQLAISAAAAGLNKGGYFILDFFNAYSILKNLKPFEIKNLDKIDFTIHKKIENDFLLKEISFEAKGKKHNFKEEVKILRIEDFHSFFIHAGLVILDVYGDYQLNAFDKENSSRLIMLTRKL